MKNPLKDTIILDHLSVGPSVSTHGFIIKLFLCTERLSLLLKMGIKTPDESFKFISVAQCKMHRPRSPCDTQLVSGFSDLKSSIWRTILLLMIGYENGC